MVRLLRDDNSLTEKKIILSAFPELQTWLFRGPDDEGVWIGRTMLGFAHYLRATRWLRSHGFEVPMGVFKQPSH